MADLERRIYSGQIEVRADGDAQKIAGYAAVFNSQSEDLGGFREMIIPGAFADSIEVDDVRALINHDSNLVLGRNTAKTLTLNEDDRGLSYEIDPPGTSYANDLMVSLKRGDIDQSSFGFQVQEESWNVEGDTPLRIIRKAKLFDVSPVTFPAYPATTVSVRAIDKAKQIAGGVDTGANDAEGAAGRLALKRRKLQLLEKEME